MEFAEHNDSSNENITGTAEERGKNETAEQVYASSEYEGEEGNAGSQFSELGSESGVEPDYTEWVFDESSCDINQLFDLTNEQALATLKYFCKFVVI